MPTIASRHTPEMVEDELRDFLAEFAPSHHCRPTLGQLMRLRLAHSPFIFGGKVTPQALADAKEILGFDEYDPPNDDDPTDAEAIAEITSAIRTALRPLEIIQPSHEKRISARPSSKFDTWGPEWLADIMASVANAVPGVTPVTILWKMPACQAFHLVAAAVRKNGGCTRRPEDNDAIRDALAALAPHDA